MLYALPALGMLCVLYFVSYYGWVRTWHRSQSADIKDSYSLDYNCVGDGYISKSMAWLHTPLRKLDEMLYARLYDTRSVLEFPDFDDAPDLSNLYDQQKSGKLNVKPN